MTDLKTAIETAGDLTQMRVQVSMVGLSSVWLHLVFLCLLTFCLSMMVGLVLSPGRQELSSENETFTPSDVERALWSSAMETKQLASHPDADSKVKPSKSSKRKRKP